MLMVFLNGILQPAGKFKVEVQHSRVELFSVDQMSDDERKARVDVMAEYCDPVEGWRVKRYSTWRSGEGPYWKNCWLTDNPMGYDWKVFLEVDE